MKKDKQQKGVINIIVVFGVGLFALGSAFIIANSTLQQLVQNRNTISSGQAFYTAESNVSEGRYQVVNLPPDPDINYNGNNNPTQINSTTNAVITATDLGYGQMLISGLADRGYTSRKVLNIVNRFPEGPAFSYGLYTPDSINLNGNVTINGDIFAYNGVEGEDTGSVEVNGRIDENQEPHPPVIDSGLYIAAAQGNGTYFESKDDIPNKDFKQPRTGVVFVNSALTISESSAKIDGALWVNGDLDLSGGNFTGTDNYFAIVVEGDLKIVGETTISGVVYVKGGTTIGAGNVTINGSLICVGATSVIGAGGNLTINYQNLSGVWDDLIGLQPGTYSPEITLWNEN